ncbi:hypothetical protein Tco_0849865 [Tanacetum coccineum]
MAEKDWTIVERTQDLVDYVYDKYRNVPVTDEMLDDLYNFAIMKEKYLSMVEFEKKVESSNATEKIYRKLMVTDDMVEYVLEKYGKNWNIKDEIANVILEDLQIKYGKYDKEKGKVDDVEWDLARAKQACDDVDLVDADDVNLVDALNLENSRLLKAKKENEAKDANEAEEAEEA